MDVLQDVVVLGGGLAGLTAAIQLRQRIPGCKVTVLERRCFPCPEAIHKVGESTVEIAAHYFSAVLGLRDHLCDQQLRKLGLRLFFSGGGNTQIEHRIEMGSNKHFNLPTYQIDRGRFENFLNVHASALGVCIVPEARVRAVSFSEQGPHQVRYSCGDDERVVSGQWVVDASGRGAVLKRQLDLEQSSPHDSNAVWFRIKGRVDVDEWCADERWRAGHEGIYSRWYSTNHLTGEGYWVWLIPLASGYTSVGVVTDPKTHPLARFRSFEHTMEWLAEFEPQCAAQLRPFAAAVEDFLAVKRYAHRCTRVLSPDRWAITGDAGVFIDPLYSPGSDFIAIQNTFIVDVISRDMRGERFIGRCEIYNEMYLKLTEGFLKSYLGQYSHLGNPRVMPFKIVWDFVVYWGFLAFIAIQDRFCDLAALAEIQDGVQNVYALNERMQRHFQECHAGAQAPVATGMIDIRRIAGLFELNKGLKATHSDESFRVTLAANLEYIGRVYNELVVLMTLRQGDWSTPAEFEALCSQALARDAGAPCVERDTTPPSAAKSIAA
jgi:flavin-dependent dehydrogenase